MTQLPIWSAALPPRRRWIPRCEDCGRRIWSLASLRRRYGMLLGGQCHRKRARAARRLTIGQHIRVTNPGPVRGQLAIDLQESGT